MPDSQVTYSLMGKHNSEKTPKTGRRAAIAGGLAVVVAAGGFGVSKAVSMINDGESGCENPASVSVVTTPEMYDPVVAAANKVESSGTACATYEVRAQDSGEVAEGIQNNAGVPDVWIPDSKVWADNINHKLGAGWVTSGQTIATSPVVLGVPSVLKDNPEATKSHTWASAMDTKVPMSTIDLKGSTPSLLAAVAANQSISNAPTEKKQAVLRSFIRLSRTVLTQQTLFDRAKGESPFSRIFPISEQQLSAYNKANPTHPLTSNVPTDGAAQLSYTMVTPVRGRQAPPAALDALRRELVSAESKATLSKAGFRVPGQPNPQDTGVPGDVKTVRYPTLDESQGAQQAWTNLSKDARMLVVLDVSGSMLAPASSNQTRIDFLVGMCTAALDALPQTTSIGGWAFSTDLDGKGKDYLELVPNIAPIGGTAAGRQHKAELIKQLKTGPALAERNGDTGLYDTVGAAYEKISQGYDPSYVNSVVVMTDGANDDPNGGLNLPQLLTKLRGLYDPKKPVKIVTIGIGDKTDPKALKEIAASSDGLSYVTKKPEEITNVFIDAFLQRGE